jgi:hypothetical protein
MTKSVVEEGDREEMRRLEYEWWELDQTMKGLPEEEWEPFVPSDAPCHGKRNGGTMEEDGKQMLEVGDLSTLEVEEDASLATTVDPDYEEDLTADKTTPPRARFYRFRGVTHKIKGVIGGTREEERKVPAVDSVAIVTLEYNKCEENVEEERRWEYERWELDQAMSGVPENEWEPFVPSDLIAFEDDKENKKKVVRNLKRPKEETGKERWERIDEEKNKKEIKRALRAGKKMRKEGKMKAITSYFKK